MANNSQPTEIRELSGFKVGAIVVAIIGGIFSLGVAYINTVPDTSDRWYGHEGRLLMATVRQLSETVEAQGRMLRANEKEVADIRRDDQTCVARQAAMALDLKELEKDYDQLHEVVVSFQAARKQIDKNQSDMINNYMRRDWQ